MKSRVDLSKIADSMKKAGRLVTNLRAARQHFGFSIAEVARCCRVSRQAVADWEMGKYTPRLTTTILLLNFLSQKQQIQRMAKIYAQHEIRKRREEERQEEAKFEAESREAMKADVAWYREHPEQLLQLLERSPAQYYQMVALMKGNR